MKRTFGSIQFTFKNGEWHSECGIKLLCGIAFRESLSSHWQAWHFDGRHTSGMTAEEAIKNLDIYY